MENGLKGCVALVTGACGNIGQEIVQSLAARGATVVGTDIAANRPVDVRHHDVTSEEGWNAIVAAIRSEHGRLDILVNNAGIAPMARLDEMALEDWRRCQQINVESVFLGLKASVGLLAESGKLRRGGASVINIASAAADRGTAMSGAYCTSKAAVAMLTRVAAIEWPTLGHAIRVNSVHPGAVRSDMVDGILERYSAMTGGTPKAELEKAITVNMPMGRLVEPSEVADVVAFLASEDARFVHGTSVNVDGGYTA